VTITNLYGSITSAVAVLSVGFPPGISIGPTNQAVRLGGNTILKVGVSGTGPFGYQWQLNGTNFPDVITTVAGNGFNDPAAYLQDGGSATNGTLAVPGSMAVDGYGNLFFADLGNRIRKVDTNGIITTVAGNGTQGGTGDGGPATAASLSGPSAVAVDASGDLFIYDSGNNRIRKVDAAGIITSLTLKAAEGSVGAATNVSLSSSAGMTVDDSGNLFIADTLKQRISKVDANGIVTTVAGNGTVGYSGDGGLATNAELAFPSGVAVDSLGNVFIADTPYSRIRKVATNGVITTVAGNLKAASDGDGGPATNAGLDHPRSVAVDRFGNLFIADSSSNRIRKVDTNGIITTVAGNGRFGDSGDGGPATNASLWEPSAVAVDGSGNLFIADSGNSRIREVFAYGQSLVLNHVGEANAGNYDVVVTSPFGSVTSSVAVLTVTVPPSLRATQGNGSSLHLALTGTPGQTYILQSTASLSPPINWLSVATKTSDASGNCSFTNATPPVVGTVFYRAIPP